MGQRKTKTDLRLLGTWQSDRRRTLQHFKPKARCTPRALRAFQALFGKLIVTWDQGAYHAALDGHRRTVRYEVVASDADSVVIRSRDALSGEDCLQHIHFDGNYYWVALAGGSICEFFRRVPPEGRRAEPGAAPDPAT